MTIRQIQQKYATGELNAVQAQLRLQLNDLNVAIKRNLYNKKRRDARKAFWQDKMALAENIN